MIARAAVVAEADSHGVTRLIHLRSDGPLVLRSTPDALYLVGGAAGPLGGDDLHLTVEVRAGARLQVRSVAASIALPGPVGAVSCLHLEAEVAAGASLAWLPEPLIAGAACRHRTQSSVRIAHDAELTWREELILGRHHEAGGSLESRIDFECEAAPLLRNSLVVGEQSPGWDGPAVVGGNKAVGSLLLTGPRVNLHGPIGRVDQATTVLLLAGPAIYVSALADGALALRKSLDGARARAIDP